MRILGNIGSIRKLNALNNGNPTSRFHASHLPLSMFLQVQEIRYLGIEIGRFLPRWDEPGTDSTWLIGGPNDVIENPSSLICG